MPSPINEGHYELSNNCYGTDTTEDHMLKKPRSKRRACNSISTTQAASNTNLRIVCVYCKKPRLVYSKNKVFGHYTNKFKRSRSEPQFVCGTTVTELVGADRFNDLLTRAMAY